MTVDEARKALDIALSGSGMVGPWGETRAASEVIDAFAAAVRADALAPATRGQLPELSETEKLMRNGTHYYGSNLIIADEIDRLRAALATAEAENAELREMFDYESAARRAGR
ncbi:MAG: hypothetical protein QG571_1290 [Pseudomonadota bacterium]|nr:hypothetical protein [Pseudomonadota bacterium]